MNPLNIHHIKVERANSIKLRYQKLRTVTSFFRAFEIFLILAVISKVSFRVPLGVALAFKLFNEYFQSLLLLLVSPQFVFILGNAIVITLFVNSGRFNNPCQVKLPEGPQHEHRNTKPLPKERGIAEENTIMTAIFATPPPEHHHPCEVELPKSPQHDHKNTKALQKKQGITEENTMKAAIITSPPPEHQSQVVKIYQRSKSERPRREKTEMGRSSTLRRSNTEVIKSLNMNRKAGCCEEAEKCHSPEDHMSNEEFRKTIEDFIAKQQMFLREEEDFSALGSNFDL